MSCSVTEQYEKHYPKNEHHDCSGMHPAKKRNKAMKLLDRYIFRQFAASFLFASITFAALFTLITLVENLDDFLTVVSAYRVLPGTICLPCLRHSR